MMVTRIAILAAFAIASVPGAASFSPLQALCPSPSRCVTALSSIASEVADEMKVAMRAKDTTTLATIRMIRSGFSNAQIDLKKEELADEEVSLTE
jgi:hypothetical protein